MNARTPEQLRSGPYNALEAETLAEVLDDRDERVAARARGQAGIVGRLFDEDVTADALRRLNEMTLNEKEGVPA